MRLVIVTGMSGSGKSTALNILEDAGYYCVDNLPIQLFDMFAELISGRDAEVSKVALGIDIRSDQRFEEVMKAIARLKNADYPVNVLFLDTTDEVLLKRYKASRRLHPLAPDGRVLDGITKERKILEGLKKSADFIIDTSFLINAELKSEIERIFVEDKKFNSLMVNVVSFGFKNGIPLDADLVFDVRFLPNPFYVDELKTLTGLDREVRDYVMSFPESEQFLDKIEDLLTFLIPNYIKEGKYQLVIAIGCTGGQHRSVTLATKLYERMKGHGDFGIKLSHRDVPGGNS